jgi:hypothetical protein
MRNLWNAVALRKCDGRPPAHRCLPVAPSGVGVLNATGRAAMTTDEHPPQRPAWECRACGKAWPCDPARGLLTSEMDRIALSVYMWLNLEHAVLELPAMPASELFDRFISWTH